MKYLENRRLFWPRGKGLGGSSSINAPTISRKQSGKKSPAAFFKVAKVYLAIPSGGISIVFRLSDGEQSCTRRAIIVVMRVS
ncbi:MAG: hypothetical protein ACJAYE_003284 [Candidatus Azotimanducaceae bacterium]